MDAISNEMIFILSALVGLILGITLPKQGLLKEVFKLIELNIETKEAVYLIKSLNEEIQDKEELIETQKLSVAELEEVRLELIDRIEFLKDSPELKELEKLEIQSEKLKKLQDTIKSLKSKNEQKFNMSALINLVQSLYYDLYKENISIKEISNMINSELNTDGDSFGGQNLNLKSNNKRTM